MKTAGVYRIAPIEDCTGAVEWCDTAEEAMLAVNRLRALRVGLIAIEDESGTLLTDQQLAMIVMEERFVAKRILPPKA